MDISSQMILFANVVDHGNFSATARALGQTPSAISKQIGHLENRLGIRLLNRSTRNISLTEEGRAFYARCAEIAEESAKPKTWRFRSGRGRREPCVSRQPWLSGDLPFCLYCQSS